MITRLESGVLVKEEERRMITGNAKELALLRETLNGLREELTRRELEAARWRASSEKELALMIEKIRKPIDEDEGKGTSMNTEQQIADVRKEIVRISTDLGVETRKMQGLEELVSTQRKELFSNVSEVEGYFIGKLESVKRALNDIAQKVNYPMS